MATVSIAIHEVKELKVSSIALDKADLYVKVSTGRTNSVRTKTMKNAGKEATFEETLQMKWSPGEDLKFEVSDDDKLRRDDDIGTAILTSSMFAQETWTGELAITHHDKKTGVVRASVKVIT